MLHCISLSSSGAGHRDTAAGSIDPVLPPNSLHPGRGDRGQATSQEGTAEVPDLGTSQEQFPGLPLDFLSLNLQWRVLEICI